MNILITGGAGFIGTHLTRSLLKQGHSITVLDNFLPQVHTGSTSLAADLAPHVRLVRGKAADITSLRTALEGCQGIVHLAAETGTGQSMYEVARYESVNLGSTALLYELLVKEPHAVERIVVASSRSIYGEGAYTCLQHGVVYPKPRSIQDKQAGYFDPLCPICNGACESVPTPETAPLQPSSFYGLTKQVQEQMVLLFGHTMRIPSIALRYQNVFGPGQSLTNPYTGILAIFSNLARAHRTIKVFEDGLESRDFVYIDDAVRATEHALLAPLESSFSVNVGSGVRTSVLEVAVGINEFYGGTTEVRVTGEFRDGDIRHGAADLNAARSLLGYEPQWSFRDGLNRFLNWAAENGAAHGNNSAYERSLDELKQRGLLHGSH
jgi:dTDP-L-rhamnose 4-epimerase